MKRRNLLNKKSIMGIMMSVIVFSSDITVWASEIAEVNIQEKYNISIENGNENRTITKPTISFKNKKSQAEKDRCLNKNERKKAEKERNDNPEELGYYADSIL